MVETPLCELAYKWGTDKCPRLKHPYTPFYYELLKDKRDSIKSIFELGIGYYKTMDHVEKHYDEGLQRVYHTGASLKMWRDFFPNAQVHGADIQPDCMFEDERITTHIVDQRKLDDLAELIKQIGDIDVFIDDGSHLPNHQIKVAKAILPLLKKDVIYVIEDVRHPGHVLKGLFHYDCWMPDFPNRTHRDRLIIVHNNTCLK